MTRPLVRTDFVRAAAALVRLMPTTFDAARAARLLGVSAAEVRCEMMTHEKVVELADTRVTLARPCTARTDHACQRGMQVQVLPFSSSAAEVAMELRV